MITEERINKKTCVFYASDYHLEMILLPYIKERLETSTFIIFTENNLEETVKVLLTKVNLDEKCKEKIINLNWKNIDNLKYTKLEKIKKKDVHIIINGNIDYIKTINDKIENLQIKDLNIIDCYHIEDKNINIEKISKHYQDILNTKKI